MALLVSWPPPLTVLTQPQDGGHPGPWLGSTLEPWSLQVGSCLPAGCGEFTSWPGPSQPLCRCRYPPLVSGGETEAQRRQAQGHTGSGGQRLVFLRQSPALLTALWGESASHTDFALFCQSSGPSEPYSSPERGTRPPLFPQNGGPG